MSLSLVVQFCQVLILEMIATPASMNNPSHSLVNNDFIQYLPSLKFDWFIQHFFLLKTSLILSLSFLPPPLSHFYLAFSHSKHIRLKHNVQRKGKKCENVPTNFIFMSSHLSVHKPQKTFLFIHKTVSVLTYASVFYDRSQDEGGAVSNVFNS